MNAVVQFVQNPLGALAFLAVAAILEAFGDACFQAAMYHSVGWASAGAAISGAVVLVGYGVMVNLPHWRLRFHVLSVRANHQSGAIWPSAELADLCGRRAHPGRWVGADILECLTNPFED